MQVVLRSTSASDITDDLPSVQVWNRADCCSDGLSGAEVFAGTSKCGTLSSSTPMQTVVCNKDASYVKVQQMRAEPLTLCEVKVWGTGMA